MHRFAKVVQTHAKDHYGEGAWDLLVDSFSEQEINQLLSRLNPATDQQAIEKVGQHLRRLEGLY